MSEVRYCPTCGTRNDGRADRCVRCGLVFSEYRPAPVASMEGGRDRSRHLTLWLIGGLAVLMAAFAAYFLSAHRLVAGGGDNPLLEQKAKAEALLDRLAEGPGEEERGRIHEEITALMATLSLVPEGRDIGANLALQRVLHDLDGFTGAAGAMDGGTLLSFRERLALIDRSVRPSSPPTP